MLSLSIQQLFSNVKSLRLCYSLSSHFCFPSRWNMISYSGTCFCGFFVHSLENYIEQFFGLLKNLFYLCLKHLIPFSLNSVIGIKEKIVTSPWRYLANTTSPMWSNSTSNEISQCRAPPFMMHQEGHNIISTGFLPKMDHLSVNITHQPTPNQGIVYKIISQLLQKMMRLQELLKNCPRLEETKAMCDHS